MAEIASATVHFQLPVWVIGPPSATIKGLVRATDPIGVKGVLLFTSKDLAQHHLDADSRLTGNVLWAVFDPWHCFGLFALLERAGIEKVVVDPCPDSGSTANSLGLAIPIAGLRAYIEQLVL